MASRSASDVGPFTALMRFVVRKVTMHICLALGLIGNTLTLITLFHKRMRYSSTTSYLTALTVVDSIYLIGIFIVNLETNYPKSGYSTIYQISLLIAYPITDFCSNTSTYLTLIFTLERYLAVKFPLHSRYLCRPSRARKIIFIVMVFCFCLTFPTLLENRIEFFYDTSLNVTRARLTKMKIYNNFEQYTIIYFWFIAVVVHFIPLILLIIFNSILIIYVHNSRTQKPIESHVKISNTVKIEENSNLLKQKSIKYRNSCSSINLMPKSNNLLDLRSSSVSIAGITHTGSNTRIYNGDQDMRVHHFNSLQHHNEQRKSIILLIVIVLMFVLCQMPSAVLLIREALYPVRKINDRVKADIIIGFNNIANGLLHLNASINFVLYCCFSDKFRKTFKELFFKIDAKKPLPTNRSFYTNSPRLNTTNYTLGQSTPFKLSNISLNTNNGDIVNFANLNNSIHRLSVTSYNTNIFLKNGNTPNNLSNSAL